MAPRTPETFEAFVARLERALASGVNEVRFGNYHHNHAVCVEEGRLRVRRLECTKEEAEAFMRENGMFMPENAEAISVPRTLVFDESSLKALLEQLKQRWPL